MVPVYTELPVNLDDVFSVYPQSLQVIDSVVRRLRLDNFLINPSFTSHLNMRPFPSVKYVSAVNLNMTLVAEFQQPTYNVRRCVTRVTGQIFGIESNKNIC